jgi:hypothetical protein
MRKKGTKTVYRIVVRGELSDRYAVAFEGMQMQAKDGQTILTGEVADQPHLHGILDRISALGLKLLSVQDLSEEAHPVLRSRMQDPSHSPGPMPQAPLGSAPIVSAQDAIIPGGLTNACRRTGLLGPWQSGV